MNFKRANTKFDELYEIRLATPNDIDNIMAFLKEYWDKNHILAVNRDFFEYEFRVGDRVNYILAVNRQTGKIDACEGIYIYSKGDDETEPFDMAGGMFRTSPHALLPFLGLEILYRKRFMMGVKMRSYIGIGAKKDTTYVLTKKYFKDDMVGRLDHFYRLNDKKEYKIAHITHKTILDIDSKDQAELVLFKDFKHMYEVFDNESFKRHNPYKSPWYINKRYFNNPVFTYKLYGLESSLVLVCREVAYNGARVLRIVDILGDREQFHRAGQALDCLMKQNDYEYIDLYQKNMNREGLKKAGFIERLEDDVNIIPNWFSPYAAKNIEIYYHAYGENLYMFKADGDMDRPCSVDVENLGYRCVKQLDSIKDISPFSKAQYDKGIESSNCHTEPLGEVSNVESQQDFSSMAHTKQALAHTYKNDKNLESTNSKMLTAEVFLDNFKGCADSCARSLLDICSGKATNPHLQNDEAQEANSPKQTFLESAKKTTQNLDSYYNAPFLPVRLFKHYALKSIKESEIIKTMTSSGTSGQSVSQIFLDKQTSLNQTKALSRIMQSFIGNKRMPMIIIDSSHLLQNRAMFSARGAGVLGFSMFAREKIYALDKDMNLNITLIRDFIEKHKGKKILLFGFTFIVWQHFYNELKRLNLFLDLKDSILIHGGGWKKLISQAVSKEHFKSELESVCGVRKIYNYYGMVEQTGSIYMECECGVLHTPIFADIIVRRARDFSIADMGEEGILELVSLLPHSYPGHIILSEDIGTILGEDDCPCGRKGKYFSINGRIQNAEIRGCSDTYEQK